MNPPRDWRKMRRQYLAGNLPEARVRPSSDDGTFGMAVWIVLLVTAVLWVVL